MRTISALLVSSLATLALGCAADSSSDSIGGGGAGGKADDSAASESGPLTEISEDEQQWLRAADAECLHVKYTQHETYDQAVKLFCLPRGGSAAPIALYAAVTPLGEADGAYKVFQIPTFVADVPESVEFRMVGTKAVFTYEVKQVNFSEESEELLYDRYQMTTTLEFSGAGEDPAVAGSYTSVGI